MTLEDVCFEIGTALAAAEIPAVLSGGAAATIYAHDHISSYDADFILQFDFDVEKAHGVLLHIGYRCENGAYERDDHEFSAEFPRGPVAIGSSNQPILRDVLTREKQQLTVISATDCVKDRLAAFYAWNDFNSLRQALHVARAQRESIDLARIATWTFHEHALDTSMDAAHKYNI